MSESNEIKQVNWVRDVIIFLTSQGISLFGSSIVQYAIMWYITIETGSGLMLTLYMVCGFLPTFLLSPFAGVWADRYNRKLLIMLADGGIALATLILVYFYSIGYQEIWMLLIVAAIRALGAAVQTPAVGAVLPQIVPKEHLTRINGLNSSIQGILNFGSPLIAAALFAVWPLSQIFLVDVVTAGLAIFTMLFLKVKTHDKANQDQEASYMDDFKLGIRYVWEHEFLRNLFILLALFMIMVAPASMLPVLVVTRTYGGEVWRLSTIEIAFSAGFVLGGAIISWWGGFSNRTKTISVGAALLAACTLGLGMTTNFWAYVVLMVLTGIAVPFFNTPAMVLIQEHVEDAYLGRVFGVMSMINTAMIPLGMSLFGPLADIMPIAIILIFAGIVLMIIAFAFSRNKALIAAGKPITKTDA
jgi:DHA3 family macrolide efflux protein-like MFS transporter